ncbi:MAG TPA: HD domain-containing protein [Geobacteraceae bacterium]
MSKKVLVLADLVNMDNPIIVFAEVKNIVAQINRGYDFTHLDQAFSDTVDLFNGNYPGYRRCTTQYHDLRHTTDVLLALARLIHGATITGTRFNDDDITLALVSALFHDVGYIQTTEDTEGTGGKYTLTHVDRSIGFMAAYLAAKGWPEHSFEVCRKLVLWTDHGDRSANTPFMSPEIDMLGKMTGTADLIGQLADRIYLEKLLFLYQEFREANLMGGEDEVALLKRTITFYETIKTRMLTDLGNMNRFMRHHFRLRWHIDADLYMESVERNVAYLDYLMNFHENDYRQKLKRGGIMNKLLQQERQDKNGS